MILQGTFHLLLLVALVLSRRSASLSLHETKLALLGEVSVLLQTLLLLGGQVLLLGHNASMTHH